MQLSIEKTKSATFRRAFNGKWTVSLVAVEFEMLDLDLLSLMPAPRFFRKAQKQSVRASRHAACCVAGVSGTARLRAASPEFTTRSPSNSNT